MPLQPSRRAAFGFAALLCAFSLHAEGTGLAEYTQAKQRWQAAALHDYQFTLVQSCFCFGETNGPLRVSVRGDAVQSAVWLNSGTPVSAETLKQVPSIGTLFQKIDAAYAKPAEEIRLTLNPEYGYPERVFVDYYKLMADEELIYSLSDFSH